MFYCGTSASRQQGSAATDRALREAPGKGLPRARLLPVPSCLQAASPICPPVMSVKCNRLIVSKLRKVTYHILRRLLCVMYYMSTGCILRYMTLPGRRGAEREPFRRARGGPLGEVGFVTGNYFTTFRNVLSGRSEALSQTLPRPLTYSEADPSMLMALRTKKLSMRKSRS